MKRQLQFLFEDIKNTWCYFLINLVQVIVGLIVLCFVLDTVFEFLEVKTKINHVANKSEVYMFRDESSDKRHSRVLNNKKCLNKLAELTNYIESIINTENEDLDVYVANSSMGLFVPFETKIPEKLKEEARSDGYYSLQSLSVTDNFFSIYQLQGSFDENTLKELFQYKEGEAIPVILGSDYKKDYKSHDCFVDLDNITYEVIGFLDENSYYVAPGQTRKLIDLSDVVIKPQFIDKTNSVSMLMFIENLYVMTNNADVAENIIDKSRELDLLDLKTTNFSYQLGAIIEDSNEEIFVNSTFLIIILIFSFVGITGNLLQFISNYKREFAIHLLCGAKLSDIIIRILMQIMVMVLVAIAIVYLIFGMTKAFSLSVCFSVIYILFISIFPILTIKHQTIQTMIRQSYE